MTSSSAFDVSTAKRQRMALPWETGLAGMVLGRSWGLSTLLQQTRSTNTFQTCWPESFVRAAAVVETVGCATASSSVQVGGTVTPVPRKRKAVAAPFMAVIRKTVPLPWTTKVADDRATALERWRLWIQMSPSACKVGRQLLAVQGKPEEQVTADRILDDSFADKSTRTLEQRAGSLLLYSRWLVSADPLANAMPFSEELCYGYLCHLRAQKAPATRALRFREAVAFTIGTVGADGAQQVLESSRCKGSVMSQFGTKRPLLQMQGLTHKQLAALEEAVFKLDYQPDKIHAGNMAALTHWRARFSDVHMLEHEPLLDEQNDCPGYFEAATMETKTSRKKDRLRKCLPLVGHSFGVSNQPWAREWLRQRKLAGLSAEKGPLMVSIGIGGVWQSARLRSGEAVLWMSEIFIRMGCCLYYKQRLGSHVCKVTLLSWLAKAGFELEIRRVLGYHASGS